MMVHVTEFAGGGFVLAVTRNHVAEIAQFLRAVGELARGVHPSPSVVPVQHDESVPRDVPQLLSAVFRRRRHPGGFMPVDYAYCDVTVPGNFINQIKADLFRDSGRPCTATVFEVVTAAIWRCHTRVIHADPDDLAPLVFAANLRKCVGARTSTTTTTSRRSWSRRRAASWPTAASRTW